MSIITIEQLTLGFNHQPVIKNFSITINKGEFIGIFGPNGAGKSSLLRAMMGLIKPVHGSISIFDQPPQHGNQYIGYVAQFRQYSSGNQFSARTYLNAVYQGFRWGWPIINSQQRAQIDTVIHLTNIADFVDRPFLQLSGGERQRVNLAQALLGEPQILLLDEPLSGLDLNQQEKMVQLIQSIQHQTKMTVLFTAHDINPLLGVMERVIYLAHGRAASGTVEEVINHDILSKLYDAPIQVVRVNNHLFVFHEKLGSCIHAHDHHIL